MNVSQRLDIRGSSKYLTLQNLSIYYLWKNIRKHYKNNKFKIIVSTWKDQFELPDGCYSVSDIQDYSEYINKNHETLKKVSPIFVFTLMELIIDCVQNKRWI